MDDYKLFIIGTFLIYLCISIKEIKEDLQWIKSHLYDLEHKNDNDSSF